MNNTATTATAVATASSSSTNQPRRRTKKGDNRSHGGATDVNQKRRRKGSSSSSRSMKVWKRWSQQNPVKANLLVLFVGLCLVCMVAEQLGGKDSTHTLSQRTKRALALLKHTKNHNAGLGLNNNGNHHKSGSVSGEEEGDDRRVRKRRNNNKRHQNNNNNNKRNRNNNHPNNRHGGGGGGGDDAEQEDNNSKDDNNSNNHDNKRFQDQELKAMLDVMNQDIITNHDNGIHWVAPYLMLPPMPADNDNGRQLRESESNDQEMTRGQHRADAVDPKEVDTRGDYFKIKRKRGYAMSWESDYDKMSATELKPAVDYTTHAYTYPPLRWELPDLSQPSEAGAKNTYPDYPPLQSLGDIMKAWPQDDDFPHASTKPIPEGLLHFNYSNPQELEMARKFRDAELPFKLYGVPEVTRANSKWTDEYVSEQFDGGHGLFRAGMAAGHRANGNGNMMERLFGVNPKDDKSANANGNTNADQKEEKEYSSPPARASGLVQESSSNFFAFFQPALWDPSTMGLPPVRTSDWTYEKWAQHAQFADATSLKPGQPHFYYQSGIPKEERHLDKSRWTFVSRDLPSLSSPTETFFVFEPESQKGIQCRFGERGVVAATHYDSGRNMIAMVTGAKRYILAPPKECASLGIVPWKFNSEFRHSLLNFGHINYMNLTPPSPIPHDNEGDEEGDDQPSGGGADDDGPSRKKRKRKKEKWTGEHMSQVEREWMEIAASSQAIDTVLKAGEVLYIPSHWFHYIISLQKSAQCNVRSGVHDEGTPAFGGKMDVKTCGRLTPEEVQG